MIYDIRLVTLSTYENDVPFARHVLRLTPTQRPGQRVLSFSLDVEPPSSALQPGRDFFGNEATSVACFEPHRRFTARATARVEVTASPLAPRLSSPPWEEVAALGPDVICLQETKVPDLLFPAEALEPLGYPHTVFRGMKGYNGVAILSRVPLELHDTAPDWCGKGDSHRHDHSGDGRPTA